MITNLVNLRKIISYTTLDQDRLTAPQFQKQSIKNNNNQPVQYFFWENSLLGNQGKTKFFRLKSAPPPSPLAVFLA